MALQNSCPSFTDATINSLVTRHPYAGATNTIVRIGPATGTPRFSNTQKKRFIAARAAHGNP